ncbi:MAG: WecB/TagA/CpsF family glycosyltransferase [Stackebrandtia sp.]
MGGVRFDALSAGEVVETVDRAWTHGLGGRIVTPNVDIVRQTRRVPEARAHVGAADLVVADGAPLVWASRLRGIPLPERVAGSDLVWSLSAAAARSGRRIFLLGGSPGRDTAATAAHRLREREPALTVAGAVSPPMGFDSDESAMRALIGDLREAKPDLVCVGLGFPKQERVIARLTPHLPAAWFLGCGAGIDFVAGARHRAPKWMQRGGLEWLHRLVSEPRRLFVRYVLHDMPTACGLLLRSGLARLFG